MKCVVILVSFLVFASAGPTGYGKYGGPEGVLAETRPEDPSFPSEIAEGILEEIGHVDPAAPISALDPEDMWEAVEVVVEELLKTVPRGCDAALGVHVFTGFARHLVMKVAFKDLTHTMQELRESASMGFGADGAQPFTLLTMEQVDDLGNTMKAALDAKLATLTPASETLHIEGVFEDVLVALDEAAVKDVPFQSVLAVAISIVEQMFIPFTGTDSECDVKGTFPEVYSYVDELRSFLTEGFLTTVDAANIPQAAKPILQEKLAVTLGETAELLTGLLGALVDGDLAEFIFEVFGETSEEIYKLKDLDGAVEEILQSSISDSSASGATVLADLVKELRTKPEEETVKLFIRSFALTLADLDLDRPEIKDILKSTIRLIVDELPRV